jgi:NAD(P)-dependent dehydrogenase (short-subunit alcohol dehydrogenase family)
MSTQDTGAARRVAIVTGGTRGIGAAITRALARDGIHVAAVYAHDRQTATNFYRELAAEEVSVSLHQANIANPGDCTRLAHEVLHQLGRVDYLVNNAGINRDRTAVKMFALQWEEVIRTDLSGTFYLTQAVLPHMIERGFGRIVNMSSIVGQMGNFGQVNYAAAKAGLFGMTKVLALETAEKGITVNCIAPGAIETEMTALVPPDILKSIIERIPMHRQGSPEDVAHVVRFLLDDRAAYITGATIPVNGGMYLY